jgi:cytochrome c oxidase subunit 4
MSVHVLPKRLYYTIFGSLLGLTALTVAAAFIDMGPLNTPVALGIACVKAVLVVLYFMHLRYSERLVGVTVAITVLFLAILIVSVLTDYHSRGWLPFPGK